VSVPLRFVVQRHRASSLHYDLRFEMGGVLASWAVPKGPTLDPSVRRLAVHVEDHGLEHAGFEGVTGGGDVIVWDHGTWEPVGTDDPVRAVADGELHADVHGEKLRGRLVLVRTGPGDPGKEQWLLLHKSDDHAVRGWDPEEHPRSVLTGRTNDEVKAEPESGRAPLAEDDEALAVLDELPARGGTWTVHGRDLAVANLDSVLFQARDDEDSVTKRELLRYAARIAPLVVPYLEGRALNLHRFPDGAGSPGFWHRELPGHAPSWLAGADEPAALVWAANFGALEWHASTSRTEQPELPTYAIFDIEPGRRTTWDDVLTLARLHRTAFERLGVRSQLKLSGGGGLEAWVPIAPGPSFEETRAWVEDVARTIGRLVPGMVGRQKQDRRGRARLDHTRNAIDKTLAAPYSPRPAPGAPVSVPIGWHELDDPDLRPDRWTIRTVFDRLAEQPDPFRGALVLDQVLPEFE
jgi:bifunctional non-homologous end joining protein LigD